MGSSEAASSTVARTVSKKARADQLLRSASAATWNSAKPAERPINAFDQALVVERGNVEPS